MDKVKEILEERGASYGSYEETCKFRQLAIFMLDELHMKEHDKKIPAMARTVFVDVLHKLARAAVTPEHIDSLRDIQGYIQLLIDYNEKYAAPIPPIADCPDREGCTHCTLVHVFGPGGPSDTRCMYYNDHTCVYGRTIIPQEDDGEV